MARLQQPAQREKLFAEVEVSPSQRRYLEYAAQIQPHHVDQRHHRRQLLHALCGRQTQQRSQVRLRENPLFRQLLSQLGLDLLHFFQRKLRRRQTSRNLRVEVPSDDAAQGNREHDPKSDARKAAKLEGRVERNHKRCGEPQQDVVVQPVPRTPLPPQPSPALAQGIEKNTQEHSQSQHSELYANHSAGLQQGVFRRKRPLG